LSFSLGLTGKKEGPAADLQCLLSTQAYMNIRTGYASLDDDQRANIPGIAVAPPPSEGAVPQPPSRISPIPPQPVVTPIPGYAVTATGDYQSLGEGAVGGAGGMAAVTAAGLPSFQQGSYPPGVTTSGRLVGGPVYGFYPDSGTTTVVDIPPPQRPVQPETDFRFCSLACCSSFSRWFGLYIALIAVSILIYFVVEPVGLLCLSVSPALTLLSFLEMRFRRSVIRMLMVITFFITVLWMIPIVVLENLADYFFVIRHHLPEGGTCGKCILTAFFTVSESQSREMIRVGRQFNYSSVAVLMNKWVCFTAHDSSSGLSHCRPV